MRLEFLGTGTSFGVPQIGCSCDVCISHNPKDDRTRCSLWVQNESTSIVVDTGTDFRSQCLRSHIQHISAVLYTHFHADHIFGLDDLRAFNYLHHKEIPIYLPTFMKKSFLKCFEYTITKPGPGLTRPRFQLNMVENEHFVIDNIVIEPVDVFHGETRVKGYIFSVNNTRIAYLTDCKSLPDETISKVTGADIIILSALWNMSKQHPGHLNLNEAIELAEKLDAGTTYLTHLTHEMGLHDVTEKTLPPSIHLAYDSLVLEF
jgi:phosphoribosyl 1,2-cyclic phosphate phosphodiesterase